MTTPLLPPENEPNAGGFATLMRGGLKAAGALLLVGAISAGAAWGVFEFRIQQEQQEQQRVAAEVSSLRDSLRQRQDQLESQIGRVEQAAVDAKLLLQQGGEVVSLESRLKEIDNLRLELQKAQQETDTKLKALEQSVIEQVAKQGKETALALSTELRWKSLLIKAQGEVLLAQVRWSEGNRGLAKDELALAVKSLQAAVEEAPEANKPAMKQVLDLAEQARSALILEQSSARDTLNLLWHRVSEQLAPEKR